MTKPRWAGFLVVLGLACGISLTGCSDSDEAPGTGAGKRFLKLGTAPVGGAFFQVGDALANVVNEHKPDSVGKLTSTATKGSQQNIRDLDSGDLDFALSNAAITYFAIRGEGDWDKKYDVKAIMTLAPNMAMFITPESSGIKTIADLKQKRVCIGPEGAGFEYFLRPILKAHGIDLSDIQTTYAPQNAAVDQLGDGAIDAAFLGGAVPTASITQACSSGDIFFIPYDKDAIASLEKDYEFFEPKTIEAGKYSDLTSDYAGLNVGSMHLITSGRQDEDLVYEVTKAIYENAADVVEKHPAGRAINAKVVIRNTGTEFHPGAIRFYKEIGIWPESEPGEEAQPKESTEEQKPAESPEESN